MKFKVGDSVVVNNPYSSQKGLTATIFKVYYDAFVSEAAWWVSVHLPDGDTMNRAFYEDDLILVVDTPLWEAG